MSISGNTSAVKTLLRGHEKSGREEGATADMLIEECKIIPVNLLKRSLSETVLGEVITESDIAAGIDTVKYEREQETFHKAIGPVLTSAQVFGIMPVRGVLAPSPSQLRFRYLSFRAGYTSLFIICLIGLEILSIKHTVKVIEKFGHKFLSNVRGAIVGTLFYGNALAASFLFLRLGSRWPHIMAEWYYVEQVLWKLPYRHLTWKFSMLSAIVMTSALIEHILSILTNIPEYIHPNDVHKLSPPCVTDPEFIANITHITPAEVLQVYTCRSHNFIFSSVDYNVSLGVLVLIGSRLATFIWNFTDLFIVLLSVGLAEHFILFNQIMKETKYKTVLQEKWGEFREHYNLLSRLVKTVEREVSGIVFLSFASNLIFICIQLSETVNSAYTLDKIYFFVSFFHLVGRTILVTMSAAQVHEESKNSLPDIFSSSSNSYCNEMIRLQYQITTDVIAFTGMRFFWVTRSFMLMVTGCIFTYEVVLLQFRNEVSYIASPNMTLIPELSTTI